MAIGLGILGAGGVSEALVRAAADYAPDAVRITGVWDDAADALWADSDCIYVATQPCDHLAHARAALAAGKAVVLDPPLAIDVDDARRFVQEAQACRVAVNFPFASSLAASRIRQWMAEGVLGAASGITIEIALSAWPGPAASPWWASPAQGGFTRCVASHFLFLTRRLLGPLQVHTSQAEFPADPGPERRIKVRFDAGGVAGWLLGAVGTDRDEVTWTVNGVAPIRLRCGRVAERGRPDRSWAPDLDAPLPERAHALELRRQLDGIVHLTQGAPHKLATLTEAVEVQDMVEAILAGRPTPAVASWE